MSLKELNLKYKYRSDQNELYDDFYNVCLEEAVSYDRAAGYFTSGSLAVMAKGLDRFIEKNGHIRMIVNPYLTEEDLEAIKLGYKAKYDIISASMMREIQLSQELIEKDALNTLAWLIYEDKLEIKVAFTNNNSLYHEKFGIFHDKEGNMVAFSGSANETVGGIRDNFEKIDVFWKENELERIEDMQEDFNKLWSNQTNGLSIIPIPDMIKENIIQYKKERGNIKPQQKDIKPREYQLEAIQAVKENNWQGILEMATGTGKTITSLLIANEFYKQYNRIFLIIAVPFTHLVEQWKQNCEDAGFHHFTLCFGSKQKWSNKLQMDVRDFNSGIIRKHVVITTYNGAASEVFNELVSSLRGRVFFIADECHYFGIRSLRNHRFSNFEGKLGLSATPDRWWDEAGTKFIEDYFGKTVYEYTMEQAIKKGALTEYIYNPITVDLTDEELTRYERLTKRLIQLYSSKDKDKEQISELNRQRSLIISRAEAKKDILFSMLGSMNREDVSHTLVYCAPGEVESITKELAELGYRVHRFDSKVPSDERIRILESFDSGTIQILVAIKCLDEGVDVPSTRTAYFLASTSNPREFVQRRGRILRKYKNKNLATIYDFIVLPSQASDQLFKSVASKELPRFAEFSQYAINKFKAREIMGAELRPYALEYLMDKLPWEVYMEFKNNMEELL